MKKYKVKSKYKNPDKYIHQLQVLSKPKKLTVSNKIQVILFIFFCVTLISLMTLFIQDIFSKKMISDDDTTTNSTEWYTITPDVYTYTTQRQNEPAKELVSSGNCVDRACAIIFNLKRNYTAMDRVKVAVSNNHCQAVIDDLGDKSFLTLEGGNQVYKTISEFTSTDDLLYVDYDKFLKAVEYYRPTITIKELLKYLMVKKENEK